jgi:hypothetical protein
VPPDVAARRGGFGGERYEVAPFQLKVRENFSELMVRWPRLGFRVYHDFLRI